MPLPGPLELVLILVIVAMLFGVGKLPEVFGAVGKGIREFRKESSVEDTKKGATAEVEAEESSNAPVIAESTPDTTKATS
ncbi:MAG: twin-arginine translocase TatA/TatE family subunit [Caldilineaceae bacterium]|nr:twin-arginine translocase TatA/TatE family subunit [Caldilineaceae bacterium]